MIRGGSKTGTPKADARKACGPMTSPSWRRTPPDACFPAAGTTGAKNDHRHSPGQQRQERRLTTVRTVIVVQSAPDLLCGVLR